MRVSTRAIVLTSVKYGEADMIVSCFTESTGLKTYMLPGVFKSRRGALRPAIFQPLTQLSLEAIHKDKGTLERLVEAKVIVNYATLHTDIVKSSLVMFLAEILKMSIQEHESNPSLFGFLSAVLVNLDQAERPANHHLKILLELTRFLGFYPDFDRTEGAYFKTSDGVFQAQNQADEMASLPLSHALCVLDETTLEACVQMPITKAERAALLALLLRYYQYHIQGFKQPKSLAVLTQIFH